MSYAELIRRKSRILSYILCGSVLLRGIVNGFYIGFSKVVPLFAAAIVVTVVLLLLVKKINPFVMMYLMVGILSLFTILLMLQFPCTTNYLMFYLLMFFVVIYEDIRPIIMQAAICVVCMLYFYSKYAKRLAETWSPDAAGISMVYIVSAMAVFIALCVLSKEQLNNINSSRKTAEKQTKHSNRLLGEIQNSIGVLDKASSNINDSITVTNEISSQIAAAAEDITNKSINEATETEHIKEQVEENVKAIGKIADASSAMKQISQENADHIHEGGDRVTDLSTQMTDLSDKIAQVSESVSSLSEQTKQIVDILGSLNAITSQTNLLSLNASIEAARAGEAGRGFAVVADEIRNLSQNSADFSDQIHDIANGIAAQTQSVMDQLEEGRASVDTCMDHANVVQGFFKDISTNTDQVVSQAEEIEANSSTMNDQMQKTLSDVSGIAGDIESTSAAMEEITSSINDMNGNIEKVVDGYGNIKQITENLVNVSQKADG